MPDKTQILVVDDKVALAETLADGLSDRGYGARAVGKSREALAALERGGVDLIVTDLRMPDVDGFALLEAARKVDRDIPVIMMTAYGAIDSAVDAIRKGAYHYLTKPFKLEELVVFIERALAERALRRETSALRKAVGARYSLKGLIGQSDAMQRVLGVIDRVAKTDTPILITGETGTGKGATARAIHGESLRAKGPFVAVNCAALPEPLLESELFGHVKGAFTGATSDRTGLFAEADSGTLLLDEIGEMSPGLQAKLLHVLESRRIRPVGASGERGVDVRVIAATHRDLRQRVAEGTFREDLLYRLDVVSVELPALRERGVDIPLFAEHFLTEARQRHPTSPVTGFTRDAMTRLCAYSWHGNVRELAHIVERCVLLAHGPQIEERDLPALVRDAQDAEQPSFHEILPMREMQRRYARWVCDQLGGFKLRASDRLEVDIKTLNRWLSLDEDN
jgi:two-component system, NtrC family, response regulator HydG